MSESCDISVIVPCYNANRYLNICLESLKAQHVPNIEMIFIDDGSTDSTGAILDAFARAESRARVVHVRNEGVSAARNRGISMATGRYIAFMDADDVLEENALSSLYQAAVKSGAFITVETALEQGRDVFAVPGQINNPLSAGPNRFLQEGARLITSGADVLDEYGQNSLFAAADTPTATMTLTKEEEQVLQYVTAEPITIEELAYLSRLSMAELMPILSMLELYGLIQQMIGRKYIRVG